MTEVTIRKIGRADIEPVADLLARAFDDDPWMNFVATQDGPRAERLRWWMRRGLTRKTLPHGECYLTPGYEGAALWVPPGIPRKHALLDEAELRLALLRVAGPRRMAAVRRVICLIVEHEPEAPHWELHILGVDPGAQGRGDRSALLRPMLARCDREQMPVGLMCTKAVNVPLYQHFGFDVTSEVAIPDGPRLWNMWREPGTSATRP